MQHLEIHLTVQPGRMPKVDPACVLVFFNNKQLEFKKRI
jgi:hypothetical protein